ncbi:MAG TPA: hypothetical protein VK508_04715 [Cyclobacteriaceae bacterium]|nr:hypothetical protein [Cyclobacteriaceae bacterium]
MDKISDILRNAKDRLSSPLFFSFLLSWIICNWRVTVALLWYDPEQIAKDGSKSIFDFIYNNTYPLESFWYPLSMAILYTLFNPLIRIGIKLFYAWINVWTQNRELSILKEGSIPTKKFLALRKNYKDQEQSLQDIIRDESKTIENLANERTEHLKSKTDVARLTKEVNDLTQTTNELNLKHSILETSHANYEKTESTQAQKLIDLENRVAALQEFKNQATNTNRLDGNWDYVAHDAETKIRHKHRLVIVNGKVSIVKDYKQLATYKIKNFFCDISKKRIFFIREAATVLVGESVEVAKGIEVDGALIYITELVEESEHLLRGTENGTINVTYTWIPAS